MAQQQNGLLFLLGEDFEEAMFLQSRLILAGVRNPIFALRDFATAKEHLAQLSTEKLWVHNPAPHLAILSLRNGPAALEFLGWLRSHPKLARIVVVVLSDRAQTQEVQKALDAGASVLHELGSGSAALAATIRELAWYAPREEALVTSSAARGF